jgi:transposase
MMMPNGFARWRLPRETDHSARTQPACAGSGARDGAMSGVAGPERRRCWSAEQKRSIVAAAFAPGASVCEVARRMDVVPSLIYRWRQELRTAAAGFAEVVVAPAPDERAVSGPALEIELGRDIRVRIAATAPKDLASAIIKALAAR